ncbi:hypothetical protein SDC9_192193 [bioreactor metagenome]|uniref:Uncharacterized protein n=1 Tax=bioreactor metagenome TaxID=1076179 RepID=A0A645I046_9ZZZZ
MAIQMDHNQKETVLSYLFLPINVKYIPNKITSVNPSGAYNQAFSAQHTVSKHINCQLILTILNI